MRSDKIRIDTELLQRLYRQCDGWLQRVHEKLVEEEEIQISYPTLTRLDVAVRAGVERSGISGKGKGMPSGIASQQHEHPAVKGEQGSAAWNLASSQAARAANFLRRFPRTRP
jgi:hypothetical protein